MRGALVAVCLVLSACGGGGSDNPEPEASAAPVVFAPNLQPAPVQAPAGQEPGTAAQDAVLANNIAGFGDSFMYRMALQLHALYPAQAVFMGAEGGQNSTQIKDRFLAYPDKARTLVIWAGRNNFRASVTVQADIAAMVAALPHDRFVVVGILNSDKPAEYLGGADYAAIRDLNAALTATYGDRFVDAHSALIAAADPASAHDMADVANDVTPASLRDDALHLNGPGSLVVARKVKERIDAGRW